MSTPQPSHNSNEDTAQQRLREAGVAPTPNRLLVLREIARADAPLSLAELETALGTLEKSSISRVLNLLASHDIIHAMEDGRGVAKYELCHAPGHSRNDMHIHFYCTVCQRTFCFTDTAVPHVDIPDGFHADSVNYMLKGLCPDCSKRH